MDESSPAPWTYAARAAYFGERVCPFCERRNPISAKFCNDCGSPLHLKPCKQCAAVNEEAAAYCRECGAECPPLIVAPESAARSAAAAASAPGTSADPAGTASTIPPPLPGGALRMGGRWPRPTHLAAIAVIMIAGAYAGYRINSARLDAIGFVDRASQSVDAAEHNPVTVASAISRPVERDPVTSEPGAAREALTLATNVEAPIPATDVEASIPATNLEAGIPAANVEAPMPASHVQARMGNVAAPVASSNVPSKHASARQRPSPAPATKHASAGQRKQAVVAHRATPTTIVAARKATLLAQNHRAQRAEPWQAMHVSLAQCDGHLMARIACDQRVRRRFCEGHWGNSPECASGIANDRGQ